MSTFHTSLASDAHLSDIEPDRRAVCKTVLWHIGSHVPDGVNLPVQPGIEVLAEAAGLSVDEVHQAVELLAAEDWVRVERRESENDLYWVNVAKLQAGGFSRAVVA